MSETKIILDACCGSRMFWFDKENPLTLFADIRDEEHILCDGRNLKVHPDIIPICLFWMNHLSWWYLILHIF